MYSTGHAAADGRYGAGEIERSVKVRNSAPRREVDLQKRHRRQAPNVLQDALEESRGDDPEPKSYNPLRQPWKRRAEKDLGESPRPVLGQATRETCLQWVL